MVSILGCTLLLMLHIVRKAENGIPKRFMLLITRGRLSIEALSQKLVTPNGIGTRRIYEIGTSLAPPSRGKQGPGRRSVLMKRNGTLGSVNPSRGRFDTFWGVSDSPRNDDVFSRGSSRHAGDDEDVSLWRRRRPLSLGCMSCQHLQDN